MKRKPKDPARARRLRLKRKLLGIPSNPTRVRREARRVARHDRNFGPKEYQEFLRAKGCLICGAKPVELAHIRARGMGGNRGPDFWRGNIVQLCHTDHNLLDRVLGRARFEAEYEVNLSLESARQEREFEQQRKAA